MEPRKLLDILITTERLKNVTRHCYTSNGRHESVAEHCWMSAMMALLLRDEFPQANMDKVIKTTVFIKEMNDFGAINEVYKTFFTSDFPARSCVEVARLPKDVMLEIEAIAIK